MSVFSHRFREMMGDWEDKKERRNKAALVLNQVPSVRWDLPRFLLLDNKRFQ